jgi:hypothetical protein
MKIHFPGTNKEKSVINRRRRPLLLLVLGLVSLGSLAGLVYNYPPNVQPIIFSYSVPLLHIFILLLFSTLFCLGSFAFKSKSHGFLIATFTSIYLVFRLNNLTHPFFFILLFGLFVSLELFVSYRK